MTVRIFLFLIYFNAAAGSLFLLSKLIGECQRHQEPQHLIELQCNPPFSFLNREALGNLTALTSDSDTDSSSDSDSDTSEGK